MTPDYRAQHKKRLSWMPWLYFSLKEKHQAWAHPWQQEVQAHFCAVETIRFGDNCFVAPETELFAEPGRDIITGNQCMIAAGCFLHGPITLGNEVAINHGCSFDGGAQGIVIGDQTRIANNVTIYAFNHGMAPNQAIYRQKSHSRGVRIGKDVWIGAQAGIVDGVTIGDHAVIGMGCIVSQNVPNWAIVVGNPMRIIGDRRKKPELALFPAQG
ncbi:MAG: acyltransferase [Shewanella sp.]|nr:acyltransferase [Shewanella sp.]